MEDTKECGVKEIFTGLGISGGFASMNLIVTAA
jgi:hypothetical protein